MLHLPDIMLLLRLTATLGYPYTFRCTWIQESTTILCRDAKFGILWFVLFGCDDPPEMQRHKHQEVR